MITSFVVNENSVATDECILLSNYHVVCLNTVLVNLTRDQIKKQVERYFFYNCYNVQQ